jgi:LytS/YehU family sensor histidine kinase
LNGLYGLSLEKPEVLPDKILQLAEIMRYHVQWGNVQWIGLKQEIDYLSQYIDFESERRGAYVAVDYHFAVEPNFLHMEIAPMILIFFVENAFKHVRRGESACFVRIMMSSDRETLLFEVENTYDPKQTNPYSLQTGIDNVERRLDILYRDRYVLDIQSDNSLFKVLLSIKN